MIARFGAQRAVVSLAAAMMLMGAKGNGCGGATESDGSSGSGGEAPIACPDGTVFDGMQCVPDDPTDPVCPDGTPGQIVCAATDMQDPSLPPEEQCWIECSGPGTCPPGTHEEWDCPPSCDGTDPGPCTFFCEDDGTPTECPPGFHYEEGCDGDVCWAGCFDDAQPCPDGTVLVTQCDANMSCKDVCLPLAQP